MLLTLFLKDTKWVEDWVFKFTNLIPPRVCNLWNEMNPEDIESYKCEIGEESSRWTAIIFMWPDNMKCSVSLLSLLKKLIFAIARLSWSFGISPLSSQNHKIKRWGVLFCRYNRRSCYRPLINDTINHCILMFQTTFDSSGPSLLLLHSFTSKLSSIELFSPFSTESREN